MAALTAALSSGCTGMVPGLHVDRFDVTLDVRPDGSVGALEHFVVRGDATAVEFERVIHNPQADRLVFESAGVDGRETAPGAAGAPEITVTSGRDLAVRWRLGASPAAHLLSLRYHAERAVGVIGDHGYLHWPVLPRTRPYGIGSSHVVLTIPAGAALYATAVIEPGWTVARAANGIAANASDIAAADGATLQAEFSVDAKSMTEAAWQLDADRAFQLSFAWVSGALFILVIGGGVIWMLRFRARQGGESDRAAVHRALRNSGVVCLVAAAAAFGVADMGVNRFGVLVMTVPASMAIVGALFIAGRKWV